MSETIFPQEVLEPFKSDIWRFRNSFSFHLLPVPINNILRGQGRLVSISFSGVRSCVSSNAIRATSCSVILLFFWQYPPHQCLYLSLTEKSIKPYMPSAVSRSVLFNDTVFLHKILPNSIVKQTKACLMLLSLKP